MFLIDLKELTVTAVAGFPHEEKASMRNPFMTKLSIFWYALELIPGLHTTILYCRKKRSGVIHEPVHGKLLQSWTPLLTEWSENLVWPTELEEALVTARDYVQIDQCHALIEMEMEKKFP